MDGPVVQPQGGQMVAREWSCADHIEGLTGLREFGVRRL
jgi:hypothetical protein